MTCSMLAADKNSPMLQRKKPNFNKGPANKHAQDSGVRLDSQQRRCELGLDRQITGRRRVSRMVVAISGLP